MGNVPALKGKKSGRVPEDKRSNEFCPGVPPLVPQIGVNYGFKS